MIKNDNMQSRMMVLQMENVRLTNEIARLKGYVAFVEEENHNIERETREECRRGLEMALMERDRAMAMVESANRESAKEKQRADNNYTLLEEARKALESRNAENAELKRRISELEQFKDVAAMAEKDCVDAKDVVNVMKRRIFQRNSDATRFLNGEIDPHSPMLEEESFMDIIKHVMDVTSDNGRKIKDKTNRNDNKRKPRLQIRAKVRVKARKVEPLVFSKVVVYIQRLFWKKWALTVATFPRTQS